MADYSSTTTSVYNGNICLTGTGSAGIGTTFGNDQLEIAASAGGRLIVSDGKDDQRRVILIHSPSSSTDYGRIVAHKYGTGAGGKDLALQDSGGNVGIGVTNPAEKLDLGGKILLTDSTNPSTPSGGAVVIYWDGTNIKAKRSDGKVCVLSLTWV